MMLKTKTIKDFPDYHVTSSGRIVSFKKNQGKEIKPQLMKNGYLSVYLSNNNVKKRLYVHRLVAETFINTSNTKLEVNHKNGNKTDNRVENLEWVTRSANQIHAHRILGIPSPMKGKCGKQHRSSKPITQLKNGIVIKIFESAHSASKITKIQYSRIVACAKGYTYCKSAGGFQWKYCKTNKE